MELCSRQAVFVYNYDATARSFPAKASAILRRNDAGNMYGFGIALNGEPSLILFCPRAGCGECRALQCSSRCCLCAAAADGTALAVGAPGARVRPATGDGSAPSSAGMVYLYQRQQDGRWPEYALHVPPIYTERGINTTK